MHVAGPWRKRYGIVPESPCAHGEVANGHDAPVVKVDQQTASGSDATVESEQIPHIECPARVAAFARRSPRNRLEIAQVSGALERGHLLELVGRAGDLHRLLGLLVFDLAPP